MIRLQKAFNPKDKQEYRLTEESINALTDLIDKKIDERINEIVESVNQQLGKKAKRSYRQ